MLLIKMTVGEIKALKSALRRNKSKSGYRRLLEVCDILLEKGTGEIELPWETRTRIYDYAHAHGRGKQLREIFGRNLGTELDKGLNFDNP